MIDRTKLDRIDWYRQAGAVKPLYVWYGFTACTQIAIRGRQLPYWFHDFFVWFKDDYFSVYFNRAGMREVFDEYLSCEHAQVGFLQALHYEWVREHYQPLVEQSAKSIDPTTSTEQLATLFEQRSAAYQAAWNEVIFHDAFDVFGEAFLEEAIDDSLTEPIDTFLAHSLPSPYQRERFELLALAEQALEKLKDTAPETMAALIERAPAIAARLEQHAARYQWIQNDYKTILRAPLGSFFDRFYILATDPDRRASERSAQQSAAGAAGRRQRLSPALRTRAELIALISLWRDERKAMNQQVNAWLRWLVERVSETSGVPIDTIEHFTWLELPRFIRGEPNLTAVADRRNDGVLYSVEGRKINEEYGAAARRIADKLDRIVTGRKELRGRVAYQGHVTGTARLVLGKDDFPKFRAGDILIAPNTRPEYLPIMRLAAAVVTEEGGLTSHAAIVARELSVPTIVGVQGVVSRLSDGDLIEVNTTSGTVKKVVQ